MENNKRIDSLQNWNEKSEVERALLTGIHGTPQVRIDEKKKYLGVFREQVMVVLSDQQIKEPAIYTEVAQMIKDKRASVVVLNGNVDNAFTKKYKTLAGASKVQIKTVSGSEYSPTTGLVVASTSAVNIEHIDIEKRTTRLLKLGLSKQLIKAAGKKVCRECIKKIRAKAPLETINYKQIGLIDQITGDTCPAHD